MSLFTSKAKERKSTTQYGYKTLNTILSLITWTKKSKTPEETKNHELFYLYQLQKNYLYLLQLKICPKILEKISVT